MPSLRRNSRTLSPMSTSGFCVRTASEHTLISTSRGRVADYARNALLSARPPPRPNAFGFDPATFLQIRMLGVNLNQIAKRLNSTDAPPPAELQPLLAAITAALHRAMP